MALFRRPFVLSFLLAVAAWPAPAAEPLEAGFATVEITPPVGYRMSGYFTERPSTGVRDPLLAKAIVLRQGDVQAALVICDLIGISLAAADAVRQQAEEQLGIPAAHVAVSATHSHTGPLYFGELREHFHALAVAERGSDPREEVDYAAVLVDKLTAALAEAQSALAPVELAAGNAVEDRLSFNRRFHMRDGSVRFNPGQQNPDIVRTAGPIDPEVGLLRFTPSGGSAPSAAIVAFALHLDTVGGTEYSGDYPAVLQDRLRESFGEGFLSLFGAGTCGDINHVDVTIQGRRPTQEIGTLLAETVAAAIPQLPTVESPSLAVLSLRVDYPKQVYAPEEIEAARQAMADVANPQVEFLKRVENTKIVDLQLRSGDTIPLEVQVFRLGPETALVTLPGEVFVDLGLAIKNASPFDTTLVIELTNDTPAYIPTRRAFVEGSYETVNSRIQPGGGEKMVEAAIELLRQLHGGE